MKASFFETLRYLTPRRIPAQWPVPGEFYDPETGAQTFRGSIDQLALVEQMGFDWISFSEHHYSRLLSPSPIVVAAHMAAHLKQAKIAILGPIIPLNNPVRVAEELAMLDNLTQGRLVVGLLRGTPNEYQTYTVNPRETRDRTTEGLELILKAWMEPQPFAWEGRDYQYRTVSVWPRPLQQPRPPTYSLGTSRESCELAARHHLGLGVSFGPFEAVSRATAFYRECCAREGWEPGPDDIIYRGNILVAETDEAAVEALQARERTAEANFPMRPSIRDAVMKLDARNVAGVTAEVTARTDVRTALPMTFVGSPDTVVELVRRCREVVGAGVLDLSFQTSNADDPERTARSLELFGTKVLPRIRDI